MHLDISGDRDAIVTALRSLGPAARHGLFERHLGPGDRGGIQQDRAAGFAAVIADCAGAGHTVRIEERSQGRPTDVPPSDPWFTARR